MYFEKKDLDVFSVVNIWRHWMTNLCPNYAQDFLAKIVTIIQTKKVAMIIIL
jgi:hypothetical protein